MIGEIMLVLARKIGEKIILNDNIEIIVLDTNQNTVKLGINAPKNVSVYREELYKEIKQNNITSQNVTPDSINELAQLLDSTTINNDMVQKLTNKITD